MDALWLVFGPVFVVIGLISAVWIVRMARTAFYGTAKDGEKEDTKNFQG